MEELAKVKNNQQTFHKKTKPFTFPPPLALLLLYAFFVDDDVVVVVVVADENRSCRAA